MAYKNFFYFDIETTSKSQSLFDLKLDDERGYDLFVKKYEKMKTFDQDWNRPIEDVYIDKSPLIPEFGKIICMSFGMFKDDEKTVMTIIEEDEESTIKKIVRVFKRANETSRTLCGFNVKSFDLPFLIKKMYKYDVDIPLSLNFSGMKPWEVMIKDISDVWKGIGKTSASLEEVTYELGIPSPRKIMSGDEVHEYFWSKNDKKSIIQKCENDVNATIMVAEKLKL
jgi:3'-5' exonuclease